MTLNPDPSTLRKYDHVTTDYHSGDGARQGLVWVITDIKPDTWCGSGYRASATREPCECCGHAWPDIVGVDAAWFMHIPPRRGRRNRGAPRVGPRSPPAP